VHKEIILYLVMSANLSLHLAFNLGFLIGFMLNKLFKLRFVILGFIVHELQKCVKISF